MEELTRQDIEDLQIALAIVLDKPRTSKRFDELWDKLDRLLKEYNNLPNEYTQDLQRRRQDAP